MSGKKKQPGTVFFGVRLVGFRCVVNWRRHIKINAKYLKMGVVW